MRVLVYGTGTMGKGISQIFAQNNHKVLLFNPNIESSKRALKNIENGFEKLVTKGKLTEENKNKFINNIEIVDSIKSADDVDIAIEAVSENMDIKKTKFIEMDKFINSEAILATNTSSLSITELALVTKRPDKVVGMHFFNPAPIMQLVEIINGMTTSTETIEFVQSLSKELGKKPVLVEEAPGFIVNRMLIPMINEAISIYSEGVATIEDIDTAMKSGANHPIGPLALADLIGLDVCLNIMDILHAEFGLDKYTAHPLLRKMVRAKKLGRKTREGFYKY
ncbi:3-hydroxyacyl-CoA dehydrogenase family protein [Proteiniclasticum ruminis]|uniref:3-hydroxybutyryl-CoA dehydrogenase n=1 Tax=Proteiniclasticum ruminis TaxID=398199 RepID=A0A1I5A6K1_9CLOT|nr:3-hydroxyacyl-CoA dehydrogenase NAD-binding domain-containing protein [Proteiniclasticum ruminis]SFN58065.1 3-hydroxybutyryl-CoA dehydrogenase [Proteiniclasticum ruminis]